MNEMEHFEHSDRFEWASGIQGGIHARLQNVACITCLCLENIAINFLQFRFMNPHNFSFLPELSKMYQVGHLARFNLSKGWSGNRNQTIILSQPNESQFPVSC